MKNTSLLLAIFIGTMAFAQDDELPAEISKAFNAKYVDAQNIIWDITDNMYEIEFEIGTFSYTTFFSNSAEWVETAKIISDMEVPAAAINAINKKYPESDIVYAEFVENNKNEKFFRLNTMNEKGDYVINVTSEGKILSSKEQITDPEEEGD